jgi:hypothetical protein
MLNEARTSAVPSVQRFVSLLVLQALKQLIILSMRANPKPVDMLFLQ